MLRLIYFTSYLGYCFKDAISREEILQIQDKLQSTKADVICIVDLKDNITLNRCSDFQEHLNRLDHVLYDVKEVYL